MRIAEDVFVELRRVLHHLRFRVQAAAGVVEIDVMLVVQPPVFANAERVELVGTGVLGAGGEELLVGVDDHG